MTEIVRYPRRLAHELRAEPRPARSAWCRRWGRCTTGTRALLDAAPRRGRRRSWRRSSSTRCSSAPNEDLARYPRTLDADVELCAAAGVDLVWAPTVEDMYPDGRPRVTVDAGPARRRARGRGPARPLRRRADRRREAARPRSGPTGRYFGEKDYQQLALIRRMVADLDLGVRRRRRADRARAGRSGAVEPQPLPLGRRTRTRPWRCRGRCAPGRPPRGRRETCWPRRGPSCATRTVDAGLPRAARRRPRAGARRTVPARLLVAARVGTTRLIDNIEVTAVTVLPHPRSAAARSRAGRTDDRRRRRRLRRRRADHRAAPRATAGAARDCS